MAYLSFSLFIQVLAHLNAENDYCTQQTKHLSPLQDVLYKDILSHLKETDEDLPYKHGPYEYYGRTVEGLSYKIHCRRPYGNIADYKEQVYISFSSYTLRKCTDYSTVCYLYRLYWTRTRLPRVTSTLSCPPQTRRLITRCQLTASITGVC